MGDEHYAGGLAVEAVDEKHLSRRAEEKLCMSHKGTMIAIQGALRRHPRRLIPYAIISAIAQTTGRRRRYREYFFVIMQFNMVTFLEDRGRPPQPFHPAPFFLQPDRPFIHCPLHFTFCEAGFRDKKVRGRCVNIRIEVYFQVDLTHRLVYHHQGGKNPHLFCVTD